MNNARTGRVVLYALLIFLAGGVTGVFLAPHLGRTFLRPPRAHDMARHMMKHLREELHLTDSQVTQIQPVVEKTGTELEAIRHETMRRVFQLMDHNNSEILSHLTPEQQTQFRKMEAEHRKRIHHGGPAGEPPPPPSPDR